MKPIPAPILARAKFLPGYCYALKDKVGYADPGAEIVTAEANDGDLSIPAIITTRDRDRVGDVVEPKGCQLGAYKNTPVVSYGHFQLEDYQIPVGTSENRKTRQFTVQVLPDRVRAICHFHQHTRQAVEVYLCVKDRIIRGTSIGFEPTVEPERLPADQRHQTGFYFREWELLEWAFCNIQANAACTTEQRDLARAAVSRGMVGGERLSAPILKSLEPLAGPKTAWAVGGYSAISAPFQRHFSADAGSAQLDRLLGVGAETMPKKKTTPETKAGMTEGSATGGGYLTTGTLQDANGTPAGGSGHDVAQVKTAIVGVMKDHAGHAPTDGPHDAYLHTASMAVHHHHSAMAHPDHLKAVADGLHDIPGVRAVTQGTELPGGRPEGDTNEGGQEGWEAVHVHAPSKNPAGETGEQKALGRHFMRGLLVMSYRAHLPEQVRSALEDCVHRKIPKIAEDHPEMDQDQRVAVAYSMCGEGKMLGLKAFPDKTDGADGHADGDGDGSSDGDADGKDFASLVGQLAETIACLQAKIKPPAPPTPPPASPNPADGQADQQNAALANSYAQPPKEFIERFHRSFKGRSLTIVKEAADHLHAGMGMNCHGCGDYHKKSFGYARGLDAIMGALAADHQEGDGNENTDNPADGGQDHQGIPPDIKPPADGDGNAKGFDLDKLMEGLDDLDNRLDAIPKRVYSATGQRI